MVRLVNLAGAVALLRTLATAYSLPETCTGICHNGHDPSIIRRSDGTYFRFSTGGNIAVHSAPDITGPWVYRGAMLPSGSSIPLAGNQDLWAPDVSLVDGQYYVYYSVSTFGSQDSAIGVARSADMEPDTWTDLGSSGVASSDGSAYNAIDGNLLSTDGKEYLTFGSFWGGIYQVEMASTPTKTAGTSVQIASGGDPAMEGACIFKKDSYYYLFFSRGSCCGYDTNMPAAGSEYKVMVCRSTSPNGGFVDKDGNSCLTGGGTVLLESHDWVYGPGGQTVYEDPINGPIMVYHYVDTRVGYADADKFFGWNKVTFSDGWPSI